MAVVMPVVVSTHSRPKAAGAVSDLAKRVDKGGFNTQPPEGGWKSLIRQEGNLICFNTQPPEGGCRVTHHERWDEEFQHTAARRRLDSTPSLICCDFLFQHTAARRRLDNSRYARMAKVASFNTQPPEGGWLSFFFPQRRIYRFNTQPPEGGWNPDMRGSATEPLFQHTAARRRLDNSYVL